MNTRVHPAAVARDLTVAEFLEAAARLGRVVVTNGRGEFEYAVPGHIPAGWREFRMVDKHRRIAEAACAAS